MLIAFPFVHGPYAQCSEAQVHKVLHSFVRAFKYNLRAEPDTVAAAGTLRKCNYLLFIYNLHKYVLAAPYAPPAFSTTWRILYAKSRTHKNAKV